MFEAEVSEQAGVRTIRLKGDVDLAVGPELQELFAKSIGDSLTALKVDLRSVEFIDSTGLRALVYLWKASAKGGVAFSIVPGPPQVQRVFDVAGLLDQLPFTPH
jgi:anti-sigma B factor antagonist